MLGVGVLVALERENQTAGESMTETLIDKVEKAIIASMCQEDFLDGRGMQRVEERINNLSNVELLEYISRGLEAQP